MADLIPITKDLETIEESGKHLYKKNSFMKSLAHVMEYPEARSLIDNNVHTWGDVQAILLYVLLYLLIEKSLYSSNKEINAYHKLGIMNDIMHNATIRRQIVNIVRENFASIGTGLKELENSK